MSLSDLYYARQRWVEREIDRQICPTYELLSYLVSMLLWVGWSVFLFRESFHTVALPLDSMASSGSVLLGVWFSLVPTLILVTCVVSPVRNERLRRLGWKPEGTLVAGPSTILQRIFIYRVMAGIWDPALTSKLVEDGKDELDRRLQRIGEFKTMTRWLFATPAGVLAAFAEPAHLSCQFLVANYLLLGYGFALTYLLIILYSGEYVEPFRSYLGALRIIDSRRDLSGRLTI